MTQEFDSAALTLVNSAYGLSGVNAEQQTFLEDGSVQMLMPIDSIARRSRSPFSRNIFTMAFKNVHPAIGNLESFMDPYNPVNVDNGYPAVVDPERFDIYLSHAIARANTGANVTTGFVGIDTEPKIQGMSDTAAGGPVAPLNVRTYFGAWPDWTTFSDGFGNEHAATSSGDLTIRIGRRLAAGEKLMFRTIATAIVTCDMMVWGIIVPVTLGQDLF